MSDNQEQHKKWIMLKKAITIKEFNASIIPVFSREATTCTDSLGTWTISSSSNYSRHSVKTAWAVFDNNDSSWGVMSEYSNSGSGSCSVTVELPEGYSICPSQIYRHLLNAKKPVLKGFNPETNSWEIISQMTVLGSSGKSSGYVDINTEKYFTKFNLRTGVFYGGNNICAQINTFKITAGKLKKG